MNYINRPISKPYSYENDISSSYSQFIPYHQKHFEPHENENDIIEFKTDKNYWSYLVICKSFDFLTIFDGKNNWVKRISDYKLKNYIGDLFKNIKSLKFTFIKLRFTDKLSLRRFKYKDIGKIEMSLSKKFFIQGIRHGT